MNPYESIGYVASMLVLAAFCVRGMLALRVLAIASNAAFIAYAVLAGLQPVLLLHVLLLPLNAWRLFEVVLASTSAERNPASIATPVAPPRPSYRARPPARRTGYAKHGVRRGRAPHPVLLDSADEAAADSLRSRPPIRR